MALLNARMSLKSFRYWSGPVVQPLIALMLSKLCLILPLSTTQAIRFQLLQAPPSIINFAGDLKCAIGDSDTPDEGRKVKDLKLQLANRPIWMAASIHKGEEDVMLWVHKTLTKKYPDVVTILVPRHPQHGQHIIQSLKRQGMNVAVRSRADTIYPSTSIYVVDTLGELRTLYKVTPIAVVGGSLLPNLAGHNICEAAAAGCAVLTGPHVGHFSDMMAKMKQADSLSVLQVAGRMELVETVDKLLSKAEALEACQNAAKRAFSAISSSVVHRVWNLIDVHVLSKRA